MNKLTLRDAIKELEELSTENWVPYEYTPEEAKLILNHINNLQSKIDKAIEYYETHQQECVIGRNKDEKLIKDYYLPAQCSKKLYEILKG